ncbi:integrase catalytic domain-containing protein [Trichonephila clavipes]|nr:integrase catalytic domain-containing protein [Trichonephila clavipes]
MKRKIDELKDQYYDIKDISESELQVIEDDIQSMEDRLEELESQKLYYLKASLQGDAKLLEAVDDSFESLITALKTRFENKRILTETHINAILEIEKLTNESARDIRTMTDILSKNIRTLKLLGFERNNLSDLILLNIILKKIDRETRKQFEQSIDSNQIPELDTFIMFLEKRSQIIDSINRSAPITHKPKQVPFHKGNSRFLAEVRLNQLWKKPSKHYELQTLYKSFLQECIDFKHRQLVAEPLETNISYFLPHHGVFRPDSKTTKLRVVFNPLTGYLPPEKLFRKRLTLILRFPSKMQQTFFLLPF